MREFKGRVSVRGLNLAYNGVTDHGCLSIAKLVKLHTELALSGFGGGGTGAGGEGKKKKGDKTETSKEESAGEAGQPAPYTHTNACPLHVTSRLVAPTTRRLVAPDP